MLPISGNLPDRDVKKHTNCNIKGIMYDILRHTNSGVLFVCLRSVYGQGIISGSYAAVTTALLCVHTGTVQ